mmetsp:Transcript_11454/g.20722  ORF Transcript_11454/g.20722 Transcript_11454/m.20722 type:complete len:184 (-) Transcript_11454:134-685(-)|eukprot:CAMPEP_0182445336 /NCGR_PEP_ID=MMETSP1172-20130603/3497_1 /TAXON_ID=708627 /ORGANISM="Timspurckia oligopyrenoides, Strain CCMP3278" /LENGTH=183 /DNA_ID=CAMNT_0024641091 /DNA_START=71 /DNA_END=622 /DNA_ORIENTATION=+
MFGFVSIVSGSSCGTIRSSSVSMCAAPKLTPGVPSGQSARNNQSLRQYVPAPVETYSNRSFSTILPKTWEGEVTTIGATDIGDALQVSKSETEAIEAVTAQSTAGFVEYAAMMKDERMKMLETLKMKNAMESSSSGRATCGESEGKKFVSNSRDVLRDGVVCVEYWQKKTFDSVPRVFGGETA